MVWGVGCGLNCGSWVNTAVWRAPKNLLACLSTPGIDFKNVVHQSGKSPVVHVDIYPQSLLNSVKKKHDKRKSYPRAKLLKHFKQILSYKMLWKRIKLVIFSLEPSLCKGRTEKYREERELFQKLIQKRYGKVEVLSVPFFGQGPHLLGSLKYWGDDVKSLARGLKLSHPRHVRRIRKIVQAYHSKVMGKNVHNKIGTVHLTVPILC